MKKRKRKQKYDEKYLQTLIDRATKNKQLNNIDMWEVYYFMRGRNNQNSDDNQASSG